MDGIWDLTVSGTPMGNVKLTLKLDSTDEGVTGTISTAAGRSTDIKNATLLDDNKIRFSAVVNTPNGATGITVNLTLAGDQATGQVSAGMAGPFDVRGTKQG